MEASLPKALQKRRSASSHVDQTHLGAGLFGATAASILISSCQSVSQSRSRCRISNALHVCFKFIFFFLNSPFHPDYFKVTGKLRETRSESISKLYSKRLVSLRNIHSIESTSHEFSFIHLKMFFLLWKIIQKYGYVHTGGGRRRAPWVSHFSLGNIFSVTLSKVVAILPWRFVLPSPKWYLTAWMNKSA